MRVGILSMQRIDNFGSLLQAYSLKKNLEALGCDVFFIDIKKIDEDYNLLCNSTLDYSNEQERAGFIGKMSKIDPFIFNRLKYRKLEPLQAHRFEEFRQDFLDINKQSSRFELCVIGSDEVFNCLNSGYWGFTSQLFGNIPEAEKVITYAASCGATTYEELPILVKEKIQDSFKSVHCFSVRDENTFGFVKHFTTKEVSINVDPVFAWDYSLEMEKTIMPSLPEHYCLIYSYRNRIHDKNEIKTIIGFCKKHGLKPISVGAPQFWTTDFIVCNPFQCLKLFKNADFVITDTFHGTVFSLKYARGFATIIRNSNKNKLSDLINSFSAQEHLVDSNADLDMIYTKKVGKKTYDRIEEERLRTISYLGRNVEQ